ncbi:MAG: hypothetical protein M0R33_22395 [Methylomonas sp.]|jgi:hypothetical protein|uniref:major capsid protein n=1 Tax=Methylomonas sp. TaxID=418 RepID=UPI0025D4348E|nr:major capsid protein [Methylomonas sp.]MCK9609195.1 hypothetical protein [Methylomonas sp.]
MATGGVFQLIANDGKADKMLMATDLLNERIKQLMCARAQRKEVDVTPTLVDIEQSHILFVNAHFKPFAAISHEYTKVRTSSGTPQYGTSISFSIPQYGDFFSDMVVNVILAATAATVGTIPAFPAMPTGAGEADIVVGGLTVGRTNAIGVVPVGPATTGTWTINTYRYVNSAGTILAVGAAASNFVRYCDYPGIRLFAKVAFNVNGNPLDDYTSDTVLFYSKFKIPPNKVVSWKRLMGQEVPVDSYTDLTSVAGSTFGFPAYAAGLVTAGGALPAGAPDVSAVTSRKVSQIVSGPQTPKALQPALSLWIPLFFWFNRDVHLAIPSVAIPYGQRFINIDLAAQNLLLSVAPGDLYLQLTVERATADDAVTAGTAAQVNTINTETTVTRTPYLAAGSVIDTTQRISICDLYINNLFMNPEIHDIYMKRIGFSLIRVHRMQTIRESVASGSELMNQLKWPTETLFVGMRPVVNTSTVNTNMHRDWCQFTSVVDEELRPTQQISSRLTTGVASAWNDVAGLTKSLTSVYAGERTVVPVYAETIDTLQVVVHGNKVYDILASDFYRDYLTWTYGGQNIVSPEDTGALMLNFNFYPGSYQPSGHINISRAREFYIDFVSSYCDAVHPCDLIVYAVAINFLLIADGSAILRYTT